MCLIKVIRVCWGALLDCVRLRTMVRLCNVVLRNVVCIPSTKQRYITVLLFLFFPLLLLQFSNKLRSATKNPLNGSISEFHDLFYRRLNEADRWPEFMDTFKRYIREVVMPLFPEAEELVYQKSPTFRVQVCVSR